MPTNIFLLLNVAVAFYNVGTVWAIEVDIFRSWKLINPKDFKTVQDVHWKKLPYWILIPVGISFIGAVALFWRHPDKIPVWEIWLAFAVQFLSHFLTAVMWGPWQAKLSKDPAGGDSLYLTKILNTHWIRTALINAYAFILLYMTIQFLA